MSHLLNETCLKAKENVINTKFNGLTNMHFSSLLKQDFYIFLLVLHNHENFKNSVSLVKLIPGMYMYLLSFSKLKTIYKLHVYIVAYGILYCKPIKTYQFMI